MHTNYGTPVKREVYMSEFTPITTQEQLNAIIGERIKKVREDAEKQAAEKYADFEKIQNQNSQYADQIAQLTETLDGQKATVEELTSKVHQYETASAKTKVALELGLPYQMASRLAGDDEETIRADAEALVKLIGTQKPVAPLGSGEPTNTDGKDAAWGKLASNLFTK